MNNSEYFPFACIKNDALKTFTYILCRYCMPFTVKMCKDHAISATWALALKEQGVLGVVGRKEKCVM